MSVSLPDDDVEFLDRFAVEHGVATRSAVLHRAVRLLRAVELSDDYAAAWDEWESNDAALWEVVVDDGLDTLQTG